MTYFNYHAKVKNKIREGKLTKYYFDYQYKNIGFALVLCFGTEKFPIREKCFEEYFDLIGKFYTTKQVDKIFYAYFKIDN